MLEAMFHAMLPLLIPGPIGTENRILQVLSFFPVRFFLVKGLQSRKETDVDLRFADVILVDEFENSSVEGASEEDEVELWMQWMQWMLESEREQNLAV